MKKGMRLKRYWKMDRDRKKMLSGNMSLSTWNSRRGIKDTRSLVK